MRQAVAATLRRHVLQEATWALRQSPVTVTTSHSPRSAGGAHDFFLEGNLLVANLTTGPATDEATVEYQVVPQRLADPRLPFRKLNVGLGDERSCTDEQLHQVWLPEQPYAPGGWGCVGGHAYKLPGERLPHGSDPPRAGHRRSMPKPVRREGYTQKALLNPASPGGIPNQAGLCC